MMDTPAKKILVVDDEEIMRSFLSDVLIDAGYIVEVASSGEGALKLVTKLQPDLIILDIILPDVGGSRVSSILKENPSTTNIPIIFLSGIIVKEQEESEGAEVSRQYIIAKPVTKGELLERVTKALSS